MSEVTAGSTHAIKKTTKRHPPHSRHRGQCPTGKQQKIKNFTYNGVGALIMAPLGAEVVVYGVTLRVEEGKRRERMYRATYAVPGSTLTTSGALSGGASVVVEEIDLLLKESPKEEKIGFGGLLLWHHLVVNGIQEHLRKG